MVILLQLSLFDLNLLIWEATHGFYARGQCGNWQGTRWWYWNGNPSKGDNAFALQKPTLPPPPQVRRYVSIVLLIALYMLCKISLKQSVWNGVENIMIKKKCIEKDINKRAFEKTRRERNYEPAIEYKRKTRHCCNERTQLPYR